MPRSHIDQSSSLCHAGDGDAVLSRMCAVCGRRAGVCETERGLECAGCAVEAECELDECDGELDFGEAQ